MRLTRTHKGWQHWALKGWCVMAWQSGGHSRTGTTTHRRWRRGVLKRDGYQCVLCGHIDPSGATVQADHIVNVKRGGAECDLSNGQTLCLACHDVKTQREAAEGRRLRSGRRAPVKHPGVL